MTRDQIQNALETWPTIDLIDYIQRLQEVMYSACMVSLDLCATCDLSPKKHAETCAKACANFKLRDNIRSVKNDHYQIGDTVIFSLFNKETIGVVTEFCGGKVRIDAGAGELEIDRKNIIRMV